MPLKITPILLLAILLAVIHRTGLAQTNSHNLQFRTGKGLAVNVHNGSISVNNKRLYRLDYDDIIYTSKRNRLIEDGGSAFLFLEIDGRPNLDRLYVFKISASLVDSVADAISSDLKDLDGDGYLEFGGTDLTEAHPSRDSMYYIPSRYYEIRAGRIAFDSACTKKMDIKENGVYLAHPADANGFCCRVIPKPVYKKTYIVIDTIGGIVPEKVISKIIRQPRSFDVADLNEFIDAFGFDVSMQEHYTRLSGYYLDEGPANGASQPLRMFLAFNQRTLMAIVHIRELDHTGLKEIKLHGGYFLTVLRNQDPVLIKSFIKDFNIYVATPKQ